MGSTPLKRHIALRNLSREHHDILIFVMRLQKGVAKHAKIEDMESYVEWFWTSYLSNHFVTEETHLFPKYGLEKELIKTALKDHAAIKKLFQHQPKSYDTITTLYEKLKSHIRFEERELFMIMQEDLSDNELSNFQTIHFKQLECSIWPNRFWD